MNNPLVSIIIPVYNAEEYVQECVDSFLNQTYKNLEIILINDGSTDFSGNICNELAKKNSQVRVYHQENLGVSTARNLGLKKARGDYVYFCDSDDYVDSNVISTLVSNSSYNSDILIGHMICHISSTKTRKIGVPKKYTTDGFMKAILKDYTIGSCCRLLFNTKKLSGLYFDTDLTHMEDTVFLFEALQKYKGVTILDKVFYYYRYVPFSATNAASETELAPKYKKSLAKIDKITDGKYSRIITKRKNMNSLPNKVVKKIRKIIKI